MSAQTNQRLQRFNLHNKERYRHSNSNGVETSEEFIQFKQYKINSQNKQSPSLLDNKESESLQSYSDVASNAGMKVVRSGPLMIPMADQSLSIENADNPIKMIKLHPPLMICLWITLFFVDICLMVSTSLYLVHHDKRINSHSNISYGVIGDIFSVIYRLLVILLCIIFMRELLQGNVTKKELELLDDEYKALSDTPRSAASYSFNEKMTYFFKSFNLNQFTVAATLCAIHQLYNGLLLWIAVYNGANKWYIITGFTYFLGSFSIAVPGICFNQFTIYKQKQNISELQSAFDDSSTMITSKSKLIAIKITIFSSPVTQLLLFFGFVTELIQFCCVPVLNHDAVVLRQEIAYHCTDTSCDERSDFFLCQLVLRLFVAMAILNNLVLLGAVLSDQIHSETSMTSMTKIFNPMLYVLLALALLFDLRITDDFWVVEYHVVNWFWITAHFVGIFIILKLLCCHLYQLNHSINHGKNKKPILKCTTTLFVEALILSIFAFLSTLLLSFDQKLLEDIKKRTNLRIWRQWITIMYHIWQIPALWCANRIQKFESFITKLGQAEDYKGLRSCFVCIAAINAYDLIYSFMFEAREYNQVMSGDEIMSDHHTYLGLYKWSYSLSFAVSHLMLWSLFCAVEFIMKYDEEVGIKEIQKKKPIDGFSRFNAYKRNRPKRRIRRNSEPAQNSPGKMDINMR